MLLAHVLLPCVSESFSAVHFFQKKYSLSALKIKGFFPHLRWTLNGSGTRVGCGEIPRGLFRARTDGSYPEKMVTP